MIHCVISDSVNTAVNVSRVLGKNINRLTETQTNTLGRSQPILKLNPTANNSSLPHGTGELHCPFLNFYYEIRHAVWLTHTHTHTYTYAHIVSTLLMKILVSLVINLHRWGMNCESMFLWMIRYVMSASQCLKHSNEQIASWIIWSIRINAQHI